MDIEFEAKFLDIDKDEIREKLRQLGAELVRPEFLQKRINFHLPEEKKSDNAWIRVRDEGNKITLTLKQVDGNKIQDQKEICIEIDNFAKAEKFLELIGCGKRLYQETKRELWILDGVEITIDEWPFLEPFIEVEGKSEGAVRKVSERMGMDYEKAVFGAVGKLYKMKYGKAIDEIENKIKEFTFDIENPFLN